MGGNIFPDNRRINHQEFTAYSSYVIDKLNLISSQRKKVIPFFKTKESFGDLDIIIERPMIDRKSIQEGFHTDQIVKNGNILSFQYQQFQTDLIFISSENFDIAYHYFSWNDIGNLLGRIVHKMGLKYGFDGLSYTLRKDTWKFSEICITKDIYAILGLLKLDAQTYIQGFDTLEDIYRYVASSPYFNKQIFLLYNRSHSSRIRDRKRQVYHQFLIWMEQQQDLPEYPWPSFDERGGYSHKDEWFQIVYHQFPDFQEQYIEQKRQFDQQILIKEKFNGQIVQALTGLTGPLLGDMMVLLRAEKKDILNMSTDEIHQWILMRFLEEKHKYIS